MCQGSYSENLELKPPTAHKAVQDNLVLRGGPTSEATKLSNVSYAYKWPLISGGLNSEVAEK